MSLDWEGSWNREEVGFYGHLGRLGQGFSEWDGGSSKFVIVIVFCFCD